MKMIQGIKPIAPIMNYTHFAENSCKKDDFVMCDVTVSKCKFQGNTRQDTEETAEEDSSFPGTVHSVYASTDSRGEIDIQILGSS